MLRGVLWNMMINMKDGGAGFPAGTPRHRPGGLCYRSLLPISWWTW